MHMCNRYGKQRASPQSLWNHKQKCERYGPPDDFREVYVREKRRAYEYADGTQKK